MSLDLKSLTTLPDFFAAVCREFADRPVMLYRPQFRTIRFTYGQLWNQAVAYAQQLQAAEIAVGDRVIIIAHNSPAWLASFWGTQLAGAVAVPLSPDSSADLVAKIHEQTEAKAIFTGPLVKIDLPEVVIINLPTADQPQSEPTLADWSIPDVAGETLAEIVYTSGTTGFPKGVELTHNNLLANLRDMRQAVPIYPHYRFVSILPLFHMFEQMGGMIAPLSVGAQISYAASLNPNHLKWIFHDDKPDVMLAVPEFLRLIYLKLMERAKEEGQDKKLAKVLKIAGRLPMWARRRLLGKIHRTFGWRLHTIASGGAPLEEAVGKFWEGLGIYILQGYGLTETSPILTVNRYHDRKINSVGRALDSVSVRLGEANEVQAQGPNVFGGYWRNQDATQEAFTDDGWYRTGDIGYFDSDNHLVLKGRMKHMIVLANGEKVHPEDIEAVINQLPGVKDSTVLGLEQDGQVTVHAVLLLEPDSGRQPDNIIQTANQRLMTHQHIASHSVWPEEDFPRTPTKKVKKHEVSQQLNQKMQEAAGPAAARLSKLEAVIAEVVPAKAQSITPTSCLVADLNLDSLGRISLTAGIEAKFDVSIDETEITSSTTVADIDQIIKDRRHKQIRYEFQLKIFSRFSRLIRAIGQPVLLKPARWLWAPMTIYGQEHLAKLNSPVLFFPNHLSPVDGPLVYAALPGHLRRQLAVAAAADIVYDRHSLGWRLIRFLGERLFIMLPFARTGQVKTSLEYLGRTLDRGYSVLFFPEGQMSPDGQFQGFKAGAGLVAQMMQVPIVPVKITGSANIMPVQSGRLIKWPQRAPVTIAFGPAYQPPAEASHEQIKQDLETRLQAL